MVRFDGTESADSGPIYDRSKTSRSPKIFIQEDHPICVHSGFCRDTVSDICSMRRHCSDPEVLAKVIYKLDNCPSGALAYALESGGEIIEPDLRRSGLLFWTEFWNLDRFLFLGALGVFDHLGLQVRRDLVVVVEFQ